MPGSLVMLMCGNPAGVLALTGLRAVPLAVRARCAVYLAALSCVERST